MGDFYDLWNYLTCTSTSPELDRSRYRQQVNIDAEETLDWTKWIEIDTKTFIGGGGYGDTYRGRWCNIPKELGSMIPKVAVKVIKVIESDEASAAKSQKMIKREIAVWKGLKHDNILPFVGICYDRASHYPSLISPLMENGNVMTYLKNNTHIARKSMPLGIACGLKFLHDQEPKIIHGDMKGANILINERGEPCLIDFGISRILSDLTLWNTSATHAPGSIRWQAPELMDVSEPRITIESDVYSFGMTCLEVVSGSVPFSEHSNTAVVITTVLKGEIPEKPKSTLITCHLWSMWSQCWVREVQMRPPMSDLIRELVVSDFLTRLNFLSMQDIRGFTILFLLNAEDREAALETLLLHASGTTEFRRAWLELPATALIHRILDHCQKPAHRNTMLIDMAEKGSEYDVSSHLNNHHSTDEYESALILSASAGHHHIVQLLLQHTLGKDIMYWDWVVTMMHAVKTNDNLLVKLLIRYENAICQWKKACWDVVLDTLSETTELKDVLVESGLEMNRVCTTGRTMLQVASENGDVEAVKLLIQNDADVKARFGNGLTALHVAAKSGYEELVQLLVDRGADVNAKSDDDGTPLYAASRNGHTEVVKVLIESGAVIGAGKNPAYRVSITSKITKTALPASFSSRERPQHYSASAIARRYDGHAEHIPTIVIDPIESQSHHIPALKVILARHGNKFRFRCLPTCDCEVRQLMVRLGIITDLDTFNDLQDIATKMTKALPPVNENSQFKEVMKEIGGSREYAVLMQDLLDELSNLPHPGGQDDFIVRRYDDWASKLFGYSGEVPSGMFTTDLDIDWLRSQPRFPQLGGPRGDLWCYTQNNGAMIAVKTPRSFGTRHDDNFRFKLRPWLREVIIWHKTKHPRILPFLGITKYLITRRWGFVSPWMENGNIVAYLELNTSLGDLEHTLLFMIQVAEGVEYLHSREWSHGNLKPDNILIDDKGNAIICDLGLFMRDDDERISSRVMQYVAPEVFAEGRSRRSADVWSFAMTMFKVLSGIDPFPGSYSEFIMEKVRNGVRPARPISRQNERIYDDVWGLIEQCWQYKEFARPDMATVLSSLRELPFRIRQWSQLMPASSHSVLVGDLAYNSAYSLFHAGRFKKGNPSVSEYIRQLQTTDKIDQYLDRNWGKLRAWSVPRQEFERMMEDALYLKFVQHNDLREALLATQNRKICYISSVDAFWGYSEEKCRGDNRLGDCLVRVRQRLLMSRGFQ